LLISSFPSLPILKLDSIQPPPTYLWTTYFLALHHSHPLNNPCPSPAKSLSLLSAALAHTPTLPELYTAKARVLKYAGDAWGAAEAMEEARRLDGQDRFLNSKAAKYWLRAGEVERAYEVLGLFTKVCFTSHLSPSLSLSSRSSVKGSSRTT
jgi:tetratricopeptide (TPR) repeat protein